MKTRLTSSLLLAFFMLIFNFANATVYTIQTANFSFTPNTLDIVSGDTVRWVWINGSHNLSSTSVPSGASTFTSPLNATTTSFEMKFTVVGVYAYECTIHPTLMTGTITVAAAAGIQEQTSYSVGIKAYPNPFTSLLAISFTLPEKVSTKISVFDITGKVIKVLANGDYDTGNHVIYWDGSNENGETVDHGLYFYTIEGKNINKSTGKVVFGL